MQCTSTNQRSKRAIKGIFIPLILFLLFLGSAPLAWAQATVEGTVTDAQTGEVLTGVNILIQGTFEGTTSDLEGNFRLDVPSLNATLLLSYIGYQTLALPIDGRRTLEIGLVPDVIVSEELVITAFGVERETKSLGYAVQQVTTDEIVQTRQPNLINSLQGKVAGVQVTNSGGSPGASSMILIRGGTSLSSDNQPLFVVDGIPIDNSTTGGLNSPGSNRAIDINPADIASITILKGPAAAALYGQRAGSGAVVITTKRGQAGRTSIDYSTTLSFDNVSQLPTLQSRYKQGEQGVFDPAATASWGPEFGSGERVYDNLGDFLTTSFTQSHDLSIGGGTAVSRFYASASIMDQGGIVENNNDFMRNAFRITADTRAGDKLRLEATASYTETERNYVSQGSASGVMGALFWPRNDNMRDYLNPDGTQRTITGSDNPYWGTINKPFESNVSRTMIVGSAFYDPFDFLNITYRLGTDRYTDRRMNYEATGSTFNEQGIINLADINNQITTSTLLVTGSTTLGGVFNTSLTLGQNLEMSDRQVMSQTGQNFIDPDFPSINNVLESDRRTSRNETRRRLVGAFVDFNVDWNNIVFMNFRGRNDWSSTLPVNNRSFFYPAVSTSIVVNELLNELGYDIDGSVLSYLKLRASWARVGKDAPPHILANTLATATNTFTVAPTGFISNVNNFFGNPALKPEFTNSIEVGADVRFLDERLGLDFSYYKTTTDEQILGTRTPPSSSSFLAYLNGGSIQNEGVEMIVSTFPVRGNDFNWKLDFNFAKNTATVKDLPGTLDRVELSTAWAAYSVAQGSAFLDGPLFGINGRVWKTNDAGELLLDNAGYPQVDPVLAFIGNREPDWIGGISNTLNFRNFSLSMTWDVRIGGDIFNATENALVRSGLSTKTLNRGETVVFDGIVESTGERNTQSVVLDQNYYTTLYANNGREFVEDGTWYRMRFITLGYSVPTQRLSGLPIRSLQIFVTGRNLLLFTDYSGVDPEVTGSGAGVGGAGSFGFDNLGVPSTRGFDFSVRLSL
ncbi:MAG: SusC/RagA family TonB-linked outer membrane protein [Rhodothermaceae bacterium]|nr:SusC/RagA family TonB-linked outer membrane protein [Rhodothermaceae bacterium]